MKNLGTLSSNFKKERFNRIFSYASVINLDL